MAQNANNNTNAGTPAAKKVDWTWVAAASATGVAMLILFVSLLTQCNGKNEAREDADQVKSELHDANARIDSLRQAVKKYNDAYTNALGDNAELQDSVVILNDSIVVLNDSLAVVNKDLEECRNKRCVRPTPVKPAPAKPAPAKPTPVKPAPAKPTPVKAEPAKPAPAKPAPDTVVVYVPVQPVKQPAKPACPPKTTVELDDSANSGAIVVGGNNGCQQGGTQIKLENGSVNSGAIVVGNGNNVVVEQQQAVAKFERQRTIQVECTVVRSRRVYNR